tara:strand:+ start:1026 stop:1808 length:783 start_codon:yes stop_codon:yes gene_type:complete
MDKKTIDIDPKLFSSTSLSKKSAKQKNQTLKKEQLMQVNGNNVKAMLLQKLKEYKRNKTKKTIPSHSCHVSQVNPQFMEKLRKKKNKSQQNIHLKDMIHNDNTQQIHQQNTVIKHNTTPQPPPYTNMKHSTKPTYREWKYRNISEKLNNPVVDKKPEKVEVEIKKRFNVGKNKTMKKVGIFLKSNYNRRDTEDNKAKWKSARLKTAKSYLKKCNLIRYGSTAPSELIRELYECTNLCGGVNNKNGKISVDNYLNDDTQTD